MRRILFLALISLSQLTLAAENTLPVQSTDQEDVTNSADASLEPSAGDDGGLIAAENPQTNDDEEDSSVRFIPTEEISQDLGVSFPVDI